MARRLKLHAGLSALALSASALALGACGGGEGGEGAKREAPSDHDGHAVAASGEGEQGAALSAAEDKVAYMSALLAIKGHLTSGVELYAEGDAAGAATHMKHPKDELYAKLEPAFKAYGAKGFGAELDALAASVAGGEALGVVMEKQGAAFAAVDKAAAAATLSARDQLLAIAALMQMAGSEFDLGVKHGAVVSLHEYQDAHGFLKVAVGTLGVMKTKAGAEDAAVADARDQAARALAVAPTVTPGDLSQAESSTIYGAAARVELKARGM